MKVPDTKNLLSALSKKVGMSQLLSYIDELGSDGQKALLTALSSQMSDAKKQQVMAIIRNKASTTDAQVRQWLVKSIPTAYINGFDHTEKIASANFKAQLGDKLLKEKLTLSLLQTSPYLKPHLQAVNNLLSDAYLDFGNSMTGYIRGAERLLNEGIKQQVRSEIAIGRLEGQAVQEIKKTVKSTLADRGFSVLLDKGGRQWSLNQYSEMITRTHLIRANTEGTVNRASDFDVDLVEVSTHGSDDELCSSMEGQIFSISGKSKEYESLAGNEPPFHPNCAHTLLMRPDLEG